MKSIIHRFTIITLFSSLFLTTSVIGNNPSDCNANILKNKDFEKNIFLTSPQLKDAINFKGHLSNNNSAVSKMKVMAACAQLFFSEYVEGSSNNKALEIYNPTSASVSLTGVKIKIYANGSPSPSTTIDLTGKGLGSIPAYGTFVIAHTSASQPLKDLADDFGNLGYNGDDAIALEVAGVNVDIFGQIGFDPGTAWTSNGVTTLDKTLRRKSVILEGDTNGSDGFFPDLEWDQYPIDTFTGLGSHTSGCESTCPDFVGLIPNNVTIVNSTCTAPLYIHSGGSITAAVNNCPAGSTLEYSTDNEMTWSVTVPVYDQDGPAQTITTRCNCDDDQSQSSVSSTPLTTVPGICPPPTDYCAVTSTNTVYGINNFTTTSGVANINNTTGSGQYTDYTSQFVSQYEGTSVSYSITPVQSSSHEYGLWIDWNDNKIFESGDETIALTNNPFSGTYTGTINIPSGTPAGDYRIRVVNNASPGTPSPCGILGSDDYGEAEDYTFRVMSEPCKINFDPILNSSIGNTEAILIADDFEVAASGMMVNNITFCMEDNLTHASRIAFYEEDVNNPGNPGVLVKDYFNIAPTAKNHLGNDVYDVVFSLPTPTVLNAGIYWVAIQTAGGQYGSNNWATTNNGVHSLVRYSTDAGATWNSSFGENLSFRIECHYVTSITISDPCVCNNDATSAGNDGTFDEQITVTGTSGQTITGTCTGCIPATLTFTEGPSGTYLSNIFQHGDNAGYSAMIFENGISAGTISNKCAYPTVVIDPFPPLANCINQDDTFPLTATITGDDGSGAYVWSGTGVVGDEFNPSGLQAGSFDIDLDYTGVDNGNISPDGGITAAYPGCIQPASVTVTIYDGVSPPTIDNIEVCEGESTVITGPSLSSTNETVTFTWDFEGSIDGLGVSSNTLAASDGPVQSVGSGIASSFQAAGSGCSDAISLTSFDISNTSLADAIADDEYVEFCIGSTQVGATLNSVNAINWIHRRSGTGPISWALVPVSSPSTPILTGTITGTSCVATGGAISPDTETCYRIYYWGSTNMTGTLRISEMVISAEYEIGSGTYNFYSVNPITNPGATPEATGLSYDPGTTVITSPQTIFVTIYDAGLNCESLPDSVQVIVNPNPILDISQPDDVCTPGTIDVTSVDLGATPTGGMVSYYNTYSDADDSINPITSGLDAVDMAGSIFVRYEIATGCYTIGEIIIDIRDLPAAPIVPDSITVCEGESTLITLPSGPSNITTTWDFESGITGPGVSSDMTILENGPTQTVGSGLQSVVAQPAGSGCSASISAVGFDPANVSLADAVVANDYFEFCIGDVVGGYTFNGVSAVNWGHRRSNTGPISWALVATNDTATPILSGTITGSSCSSAGGTIPLNTESCYRVYYWGASNVSGTLRIDNFIITGQYDIPLTYNWYDIDPDANPLAIPVATGPSYDPMTTFATSPESVWVTVDNGCVSPASEIVITVIQTPTVNNIANQGVCHNASTSAINFTGTPSGVVFTWTNSDPSIGLAASGTGNIASFLALNPTTINKVATITVTPSLTLGGNTCTGTARTFTITVYPRPVPIITFTDNSGLFDNDGIICQGDNVTLTANGGGSYLWSTGATTSSIIVDAAGTYTVTVTSINNCTGTASGVVIVQPVPTVSISVTENSGVVPNDGIIYTGSSATLMASGGGTYLWSTGATTASITVTPPVTTTYTVTVTNSNNCSTIAERIITVVDPPCYLVCSGDQTITLGGGLCEYQLANLVTRAGDCQYFTVEQVSGPKPGEFLKKGIYEIKYQIVSNLGELIDECTFTVTIVGLINTSKNLVCNNLLNISTDENCEVTLNADMFLEGGPYGCYGDYIIKIWPNGIEANKYSIEQGVSINIPLGTHMYEIVDPLSGNSCWGSFKVEDKLAPIVDCHCEDKDIIAPITEFAGALEETDPLFDRCGAFFTPQYYDVYEFYVSATGSYTFTAADQYNDTYGYIYANSFDPNDPCTNVIAENDDGAGNADPLITVTLTEGVKYFYVYTTYWEFDFINTYPDPYTITITSQVGTAQSIQNGADLPECQFKCYDLDVVKAETVSMLYKYPGEQNKAVLTTPPSVVDACGGVDRSFVDRVINKGMCEPSKLKRTWTFTDASGNKASCTQTFTFSPLQVSDLTPPVREIHMSCGENTSPADVAAYFDVDSRPQPASASNIGAFADDYAQTPSVVELQEGHPYGYFTYPGKGYDGNFHPQKVDNAVCNIFVSYTDQNLPACGLGCGGNMKVIRTWNLLDWCTSDIYQYIQIIKAVDEKAPTFGVMDVTVSVDPWECFATWSVVLPWELEDNCAKPEELKWGVEAPEGSILLGKQPNYVITKLPKGIHAITYWAEDCCGNRSEQIAYVTVVDATAPVAVAKQNIVISLTGGGSTGDGVAKLFAWHVDNGSYDQCSPVKFEIRRLDGGACSNIGADGK